MPRDEQDTAVSDVAHDEPIVAAHDCLVVIYRRGGDAGKCVALNRFPLRIGRDVGNELVVEGDGVSRRHARIEKRGERLVLMDVGSTNGTLLNDAELSGIAELKSGDRIKIGSTIFKYLGASDAEASLHEQIFASTTTDELTGLRSKRFLNDELAREFSRARRYNRALSVLVIDIDHFKIVNDTHGHQVGDITLQGVAACIRACLGADDTAARFGGEEMVVLLPEAGIVRALEVAQRIRAAVERHVVAFRDAQVRVTVSIGCAEYSHGDDDEHEVFERADQNMYAAKESGRNAVRA